MVDCPRDHLQRVAEQVVKLEERFRAGDRATLLEALAFCLRYEISPPEWVVRAYGEAFSAAAKGRLRTWDEAFGKPRSSRPHLRDGRLRSEVALEVWSRLVIGREHPINEQGFAELGTKMKLTGSMIRDLLREQRAALGQPTRSPGRPRRKK